MMDAYKKAKLEQRFVVVLVVIFCGTLYSSLKRLGVLGGNAKMPASAVASHPASPSPLQQLSQHLEAIQEADRQETASNPPPPTDASAPETTRDPLVSLLPNMSPERAAATATTKPATKTSTTAARPSAQPPNLDVQGLILGPRPQALIDRQLYQVGDTVKGARIVAIRRDGVEVAVGGTTFVLGPTATFKPGKSLEGGSSTPGNTTAPLPGKKMGGEP